MRSFDVFWIADLLDVFHKPDGNTSHYCKDYLFWEVGHRGFQKKDLIRRMSCRFKALSAYRNNDCHLSFKFVLRSRGAK